MEARVWTDNTITLSGIYLEHFKLVKLFMVIFGDATIVSIAGNVLTVAWNPDSSLSF